MYLSGPLKYYHSRLELLSQWVSSSLSFSHIKVKYLLHLCHLDLQMRLPSCGGGGTNVGMGVGGLRYKMFSVGCSGGFKVVGGFAFLFLFLRGGEANISGSVGLKSVSGGSFVEW